MTQQYGTRVDAPIVAGNDDSDDIASAIGSQIQGIIQVFTDIPSRTKWTTNYPSRLKDTTSIVLSDDSGDVTWSRWNGKQWADFIPMSNDDLKQAIADLAQQIADLKSNGGGSSGINIHMAKPFSQFGEKGITEISVLPPLNVYSDPDVDHGIKFEIKPGTFEPMHSPSFLAYLSENEKVVGKIKNGARGHHDGALWFDDIIWPAGAYIETKRDDKTYGIQEADELDPNVTGGMDYLVAFRISMVGNAPDDGYVRAYLYQSKTAFQQGVYLEDKNGQPMVVERQYKAGDRLGSLDAIGVINAKGIKEFTCHVVDNFDDDILNLTDRTQGATGLMIQALKKDSKTGMGLIEFEADTKQNIQFSGHYLGEDRVNMNWVVSTNTPVKEGAAGLGQTMADGLHFYNISPMKMGVQDGHVLFQDNGSDICDFNFGKIFSAEETKMLRDKEINVTATVNDKDSGYYVALVKWTGKPDKYTPEIFKSRNNMSPIFDTGWSLVDTLFISEDIVIGDHTDTKTFTVPADANNYAVIIYPVEEQQPLTLKLKQLKVDVKTPFNGYALSAPELLNEQHLTYSNEYKKFVQDTQGNASLRYTLNNVAEGLPMPVGEPIKGSADVSLDPNVNEVVGSQASGGEGAIKFEADGKAIIKGQVRVWNEQNTDSNGELWWCTVGPDGSLTKIDSSETYIGAAAKAKNSIANLRELTIDVEAGDRIALRGKADKADGLFLECNSDDKPLIYVEVTLKELVATA